MKSKRPGFTLIETLVSLMIFSISIAVMGMVLQGIHHEFNDSYASDFYLYLNVIENHGYRLRRSFPRRLILTKGHKTYDVKFAKDKLVMSTSKGGYIPILDNVRSINWRQKKSELRSRAVMINGEQFTGKSYLHEN